MFNKKFLITYKLFFALLVLGAIIQETIVMIGNGTYDFVEFWTFFTNQSNLFAAITLLVTAGMLIKGTKSKNLILYRGAATLYLIITGIVFAVFLSGGEPNPSAIITLDTNILHKVMPIAMLVDWLINPPAKRIGFKRALIWIAYPLIYAGASLIRGLIDGYYPYPFFDPTVSGYGSVLITTIGITLFGLFLTYLLTRLPIKSRR